MSYVWKPHKFVGEKQILIDTETPGGPFYAVEGSTKVHTTESAAEAEARGEQTPPLGGRGGGGRRR